MLSYFCYPPAPFYLHFRSWPTYIPRFTLTIIQSLLWKTQYPISLSAFIITAKITQPSIISVTAPQQLQRVMQMGRKTAETNHHKLVGLKYNRNVCVCVCVCVCVRARARMHSLSHVRFFVTSWAVTLPGASVYGICQASILEWVAFSYSRGSSWPRGRAGIFGVSWIGRQILYHCAAGEALITENYSLTNLEEKSLKSLSSTGIKVLSGPYSPRDCGEECVPWLYQPLVSAGNICHVAASFQFLPLWSHCLLLFFVRV